MPHQFFRRLGRWSYERVSASSARRVGRSAIVAFAFFLGGCGTMSAPSDQVARTYEYIATVAEADAPGCAVGAFDIEASRWIFRDAFGLADMESDRPIMADSIFGVASVTKQFTAAAVAIAAFEGHLSLDADVRDYLPELPDYGVRMTIRDLIYHTNGLRDIGRLTMLTGRPSSYLSQEARISLMTRQRGLNFAPGQEFRYGNTGYLLVAEIIERTTGEMFPDYVDRVIFKPLGMNDTYFGAGTRGRLNRALPYSDTADGWRNDDPFLVGDGEWGHQGLMTTLDDYAKWLTNLYAEQSKLKGATALTQLLRSQGTTRNGAAIPYGFGLRFETYKGLPTIGHGGSGLGYKAHTMIFPSAGMAVLGFCNHGRYAQPMVMRIADILLDLKTKRGKGASKRPAEMTPTALARFVGVYREPTLRLPMTVEATENGLRVTGDAKPSIFKSVSASRFRDDENMEIAFEFGRDGLAETLLQLSRRQYGSGRFERIERTTPSIEALETLAGDYYSSELGATYRFAVSDGRLTGRILDGDAYSISPFVFQPMLKDEFVSTKDRLAIKFQRNENGAPTGLLLTYQFGWITDIQFERADARR